MPPVEDTGLQSEIVNAYKEALAFYKKMVDGGVEKRDAIYVIPHAINLGIVMLLDGYHIFDPFGFVGIRTCSTTDHEVTAIANAIANKVAKEAAREVPGVENLIGPKCKLGYCPEREFCGLVKKFVKDYDEKMHAIFQ
jgi:thymidylate synthase ThyX